MSSIPSLTSRAGLVLAALMLVAACTPGSRAPVASPAPHVPFTLEGPTWTLIELGGHPVSVDADGRLPHFRLTAGTRKFEGFGGCNRLSGSYEAKGAVLRFPLISMTRMACAATMQLEQAFVTTLEATDQFRIEDGTLELISGGKARARLRARL